MKKMIAGVLSAVLCTTAMLSGSLAPVSKKAADSGGTASKQSRPDDLQGENALTRYLVQHTQDADTRMQPIKAAAADAVYGIGNLDFDAETGTVRVTTTQTLGCKIAVTFTNDDDPSQTYKLEQHVAAGEYVSTEIAADKSRIPAYFKLSAQLVNTAGIPICKPFHLKTFTRSVQEIREKVVSDFDAEQVVNLDESDRTNFLVLSEDTVRAESTAGSNTLVSADYDQNVYVFDHIDDSIRSLESGEYFFIQPTESDMIAVNVRDVEVDGDTATVSGTNEIDNMFEIIKIELENQTYESHSEQAYRALNAQSLTEEEFEDAFRERTGLDPDKDMETITFTKTVEKEYPTLNGHFVLTPSLGIESTYKFNFYGHFSDINVVLIFDAKAQLKLSAKLTTDGDDETSTSSSSSTGGSGSSGSSTGSSTSSSGNSGSSTSGSGSSTSSSSPLGQLGRWIRDHAVTDDPDGPDLYFPVYANAPLFDIGIYVDWEFEVCAEGTIGLELHFTKGIMYDSDDGVQLIDFDNPPVAPFINLNGELSFKLTFGVQVRLFDGLVHAHAGGGLKFTVSVDSDNIERCNKEINYGNIFTINAQNIPNRPYFPDNVHSDDWCLPLEIELKTVLEIGLEFGLKIGDNHGILHRLNDSEVGFEISRESDTIGDIPLPKIIVYIACNDLGDYKGLSFNCKLEMPDEPEEECAHQAFRTTFVTHFLNMPEEDIRAKIVVDGAEFELHDLPESSIVMYAALRKNPQDHYTYFISTNDRIRAKGTFVINDSAQVIENTIDFNVDPESTSTVAPPVTTAQTTTTVTTTSTTSPIQTATVPAAIIADRKDYIRLGDHIYGIVPNDGVFSIWGYGDMYDDPNLPFGMRDKVRSIVFTDQDPENGLYINSIGAKVFSSMPNLGAVYMPARLKKIGSEAFTGDNNLLYLRYGARSHERRFILPDTLEEIGDSAFKGCTSAAFGDLRIPDSVTIIGNHAFEGCAGITTLQIPGESGIVVGEYAFTACSGLTNATLAVGISHLGRGLFNQCLNIEDVTVPSFDLVKSTNKQHFAVLFTSGYSQSDALAFACEERADQANAWNWYVPKSLKTVTVLTGTEVPESFFSNLYCVDTVNLPDGITAIGNNAFSRSEEKEIYASNGGGVKMIRFGKHGSPDAIMLPDTLQTIGDSAFFGCRNAQFRTLTIPDSVMQIGQHAFMNCDGLETVIVPGAGKTAIAWRAFSDCPNLERAVLWDGIKNFGNALFLNCDAFKELVLYDYDLTDSVTDFFTDRKVTKTPEKLAVGYGGDYTRYKFHAMADLTEITLPVRLSAVEDRVFEGSDQIRNMFFIAEQGDWNDVAISEIGNDPLRNTLGKDRTGGKYLPLAVLADPESANVFAGTPVSFYTMAAGKYDLFYRWQYSDDNGAAWTDTDCDTYKLTVTADAALNGRLYRCVVTDAGGNTVTSDAAKLSIDGASPKPEGYHPGDLNGDGQVDVSDVVLLARFLTEDKDVVISSIGVINADVDGNGNAGIEDVTLMLQYIARIIRVFPVDATN